MGPPLGAPTWPVLGRTGTFGGFGFRIGLNGRVHGLSALVPVNDRAAGGTSAGIDAESGQHELRHQKIDHDADDEPFHVCAAPFVDEPY
jgi:hypothetical protein